MVRRYNVVEGDSIALLEIDGRNALDMGDAGYIRRFAANPTQDANVDLAAVLAAGESSLKPNELIVLRRRTQ